MLHLTLAFIEPLGIPLCQFHTLKGINTVREKGFVKDFKIQSVNTYRGNEKQLKQKLEYGYNNYYSYDDYDYVD